MPTSDHPSASVPAPIDPRPVLRFGARSSPLSLVQSGNALVTLQGLLPDVRLELVPMSSPGDEDRRTDLRVSDPDFFTRYLDDAVRDGRLDGALHSAKDLPDPMPDSLDWAWLPWREDPRDAIVLRPGVQPSDLGDAPVVGVSSDRRVEWCRERWPNAVAKPIRGNIDDRIAQLDAGDYDLVIIAYAALLRLDLAHRATEVLSLDELPTPAGQGYLALTFRPGDARMQILRSLFVKATRFVGGGPGDAGLCTLAGRDAIAACDVCLYDALVSHDLLRHLPPTAEAIFVGKRGRTYTVGRDEMQDLIELYQRRGIRLVHLKGGDPAIFGRLVEQVDGLNARALPYRVIPGVSSLTAASSATGLLLTRRAVNRGFTALTCRTAEGESLAAIGADERRGMPLVFFMGVFKTAHIAAELIADGRSPDEPAAMVFGASMPEQTIITGTLSTLADRLVGAPTHLPGLLIVGTTASAQYVFPPLGALGGRRVMLTCSLDLMPEALRLVEDGGGWPIQQPLIALEASRVPDILDALRQLASFDWLVLTSPAAVRCLFDLLPGVGVDLRRLPRLLVNGPGTADALRAHGVYADAQPAAGSGYTADAMLAVARQTIKSGQRVLRLRSDKAGDAVATALRDQGAVVHDVVLYHNVALAQPPSAATAGEPPHLAPFDDVCFASGSAVDTFVAAWGTAPLAAAVVVAIGGPTAAALRRHGVEPTIIPPDATIADCIASLAAWHVNRRLRLACMAL